MADPNLQIREGGGHPDPEIGGVSKKIFRPIRPQFGLKIRGGGLPWIHHCKVNTWYQNLLASERGYTCVSSLRLEGRGTSLWKCQGVLIVPFRDDPFKPHYYSEKTSGIQELIATWEVGFTKIPAGMQVSEKPIYIRLPSLTCRIINICEPFLKFINSIKRKNTRAYKWEQRIQLKVDIKGKVSDELCPFCDSLSLAVCTLSQYKRWTRDLKS